MKVKTVKLGSHTNGYFIDGYEEFDISPNVISVSSISERHRTYYISLPYIVLLMVSGDSIDLYFENKRDAESERERIIKELGW